MSLRKQSNENVPFDSIWIPSGWIVVFELEKMPLDRVGYNDVSVIFDLRLHLKQNVIRVKAKR